MVKHHYNGLKMEEVEESRREKGNNALPPPVVETFWEKLWDNFSDPLIKILVVALVITLILAILGYSDWIESMGIASAVFLATFVSTYSEHKNEASFQALQTEAARTHSNVYRQGVLQNIFASEIVVGDYVLLQPGEIVPADGILINGNLLMNEASLTGEAESRGKSPLDDDQHDELLKSVSCKRNSKYQEFSSGNEEEGPRDFGEIHHIRRSTIVVDGEGVIVVNAVGLKTEYGKIAAELSEYETRESPLQVKLSMLADQISKLGYIGASAIAVSFLFKQFVIDNHWDWAEMMKYFGQSALVIHDLVKSVILAIIVIVVAVPEGLPMMIAIVLSLNMNRLLKDKVLVRKLLGIETAGSISILFADKTGTMTKGQFDPVLFLSGSFLSCPTFHDIPAPLARVVDIALRVSTECVISGNSGEIIGGNASDQAVLSFIPKSVLINSEYEQNNNGNDFNINDHKNGGLMSPGSTSFIASPAFSVANHISQLEPFKHVMFNSTRKFSATSIIIPLDLAEKTTLAMNREGGITFLKGAPELLLNKCTHFYGEMGNLVPLESLESLIREINLASSKGIRVIVVATTAQLLENEFEVTTPPNNLHLVGVIGIRDEIRPTTKGAIMSAAEAGIHTIMITGDKKETAMAVAREAGLLDVVHHMTAGNMNNPGKNNIDNMVLTSEMMRKMSDVELKSILGSVRVIARALPTDKSRLVQLAQEAGQVVGMTGDGLNDAVALRMADVGFAMGSGVDVAKEASDIIILDDNFASTMKAVLYGRTIFKSIRKFIVFQSTINLASMCIVFMGPILGFDFPLTLIQLLWVNLVMDTLAALAFGGEAPLARYMTENPIQRHAGIISEYMWSSILANGIFIAILSIFFLTSDFVANLFIRDNNPDHPVFLTAFFAFFIFISNFNAFNARTTTTNLLDHIGANKNFVVVVAFIFILQTIFTYFGGSILRTVPLSLYEWLIVFLFSAIILPFDLARKIFVVPRLERKSRLLTSADNLV